MKVLIADDDEDKLEQTSEFFTIVYGVRSIEITKSLQSSLRAIIDYHFDLAVLDMTMPTFDRTLSEEGGRPHAFAGREILRQMKRRQIKTPVIVLTSFDRFGDEADYTTLDQLKKVLQEEYPNYIGTVQLKANVDDWRVDLQRLVDDHVRGKCL